MYHGNIAWNERADRFAGYFHNNRGIYTEYNEICTYLYEKKGDSLGLYMGRDSYIYPIWAKLKNCMEEIQHVMVQNESSKYAKADFLPKYIVTDQEKKEEIEINGERYVLLDTCNDNETVWLYQCAAER